MLYLLSYMTIRSPLRIWINQNNDNIFFSQLQKVVNSACWVLLLFSYLNQLKKIFLEYDQSVKQFGYRSGPDCLQRL